MIRAGVLVAVLGFAGCFPGRCGGAFRWLSTPAEASGTDKTKTAVIAPNAVFVLNADSAEATPAELVARAKVSSSTFFIVGGGGPVAAEIEAHSHEHAHSCASAATFTLRPSAPLAKGDYTVVLLLDAAGWPAVFESDVSTYEGKRALSRRYRVE